MVQLKMENFQPAMLVYQSFLVFQFATFIVDGRNPVNSPVEVGSLSHLQGFIHSRWLFGISSINIMFVGFQRLLLFLLSRKEHYYLS